MTERLGIDWSGPKRQVCPACGRGPKDHRNCGVGVDPRDGLSKAHCFRCRYVEVKAREVRDGVLRANRGAMPVGSARHEVLSEYGHQVWNACRAVAGEAAAYLAARSCVIPPADGDLRWHPALPHRPSGMLGPALVALVTDAATRQPLTLHRTWVRADGTKAPLDPPRMLLGNHRKAGGVVRLWPDEAVATGLGIAEGIETALSLAHAYRPVWSLIDAGNLADFQVLAGVEALLIAADNDEAGMRAAAQCGRRWAATGVEVRLTRQLANDINDVAEAAWRNATD